MLIGDIREAAPCARTLGYVFTASPTDRAAYFRAVLDTQDLEDFRAAVAGLVSQIAAPDRPELCDLAWPACGVEAGEAVFA